MCRDFLRYLDDYLDRLIAPELHRKLESHIGGCRDCTVILNCTQKTIRLFRNAWRDEVPRDVHLRLMSAVEAKMTAKNRHNSG